MTLIGYGLLECMREIRPGMYAGMSRMEEEKEEVRLLKKEEDERKSRGWNPRRAVTRLVTCAI